MTPRQRDFQGATLGELAPPPHSPEIVLLAEDVTVPLVAGQLPLELHAALGALQAARVPLPLHRGEVKFVHDAQPATRAQRRRGGPRPAAVRGRIPGRRGGTDGAIVLAPEPRCRHHRRVFHGTAGGRDPRGTDGRVVRTGDPTVLCVAGPAPVGVAEAGRGPGMRRRGRRSACPGRPRSRRCRGGGVAAEAHGLTEQVLLERMKWSARRGRRVRRSLK